MLFYAEKNKGAYLNRKKIKKKIITDFSKSILVDNYPSPTSLINKIINYNQIPHYKESGSLGLKISMVASNMANIMVKPNKCKIWDIAPPLLILSELSGKLYEFNGKLIDINNLKKNNFNGLIALSNKLDISKIINLIKKI